MALHTSLRTRLLGAFALVFGLSVAASTFAITQLNGVRRDLVDIVEDNYKKDRLATDMSDQVHMAGRIARTMVILDEPEAKRVQEQRFRAAMDRYRSISAELRAMPASDKGRELLAAVSEMEATAIPAIEKLVGLAKANDDRAAAVWLISDVLPKSDAWLERLDAYGTLQHRSTDANYQKAKGNIDWLKTALTVSSALSVLIGLVAAWRVSADVVRRLSMASEAVGHIAHGDLTHSILPAGSDEIGGMVTTVSKMQEALRALVGTVQAGVHQVAATAAQIASANRDLSARTETQASALEETSAASTQLTSTVGVNADNARTGTGVALQANDATRRAGVKVREVQSAMDAISDSAKKMGEIISTIEGIAFQTNILALNAAVEAARAGEHGSGFAVVAQEVRALAGRSSVAAKEIKALISTSIDHVSAGGDLVASASTAMAEVEQHIAKVNNVVEAINQASIEQLRGMGEIGSAVRQIDETTQQNAALVEQTSAAADMLRDQAQRLLAAASQFRLQSDTTRLPSQRAYQPPSLGVESSLKPGAQVRA